jgi:hypothetical protein
MFELGYKVTSQMNEDPTQEHYQGLSVVEARRIFLQQIRECLDIGDDEPIYSERNFDPETSNTWIGNHSSVCITFCDIET